MYRVIYACDGVLSRRWQSHFQVLKTHGVREVKKKLIIFCIRLKESIFNKMAARRQKGSAPDRLIVVQMSTGTIGARRIK